MFEVMVSSQDAEFEHQKMNFKINFNLISVTLNSLTLGQFLELPGHFIIELKFYNTLLDVNQVWVGYGARVALESPWHYSLGSKRKF